MTSKTRLMVGAGGCLIGLFAWAFYFRAFAGVRGEDWLVFYSATQAFFDGRLGSLYDGVQLTAVLNARFAAWLAHPLPLHPWLYPPHYLLLMLPFGLAPAGLAAVLFEAASFAALAVALGGATDKPGERVLVIAAALLCPATPIVVWLGQNTFLTAALLIGGFALAERRPVLAGVLLGILTYKPQLWLMVPVALIAARQWKVLAAAAASAAVLMLASAAAFGTAVWADWLRLMTMPSALFEQWQSLARLNGQSLYTCATLLGAGPHLADAVQLAGTALAGLAVWRCFRRSPAPRIRIAVLLAATAIAAPHIIVYDGLLLGLAAVLPLVGARPAPADAALAAALWASALISPPSVFIAGLSVPLLAALFIVRLLGRATPDALPSVQHAEGFSPAGGFAQPQVSPAALEHCASGKVVP